MKVINRLIDHDEVDLRIYVTQLTHSSECKAFKIGITSNPEARAEAYERDEEGAYNVMYVVAETDDYDEVCEIESELIGYHWDECDNMVGGGGGPGRFSKPPYYVYVVVRKRKLNALQRLMRLYNISP